MSNWTVEYTTNGQSGTVIHDVTNSYGRHANRASAEAWLRDNPVRDGRVVPAEGSGPAIDWNL